MSVFNRLLGEAVQGPKYAATDDDRYYQPNNAVSTWAASGVQVSPESALSLAAVFSAVRVLAETVGMLPLVTYRQVSETKKERAKDVSTYDVLLNRPNNWQTPIEFKEMIMGHCALRGNGYALIVPEERRGAVGQLIPLHPDRMRIWQVPKMMDMGRMVPQNLVYQYTWGTPTPLGANTVAQMHQGKVEYFTQDEIFHFRGMSFDGISGVSTVRFARDSIGLALAADGFAQRMFDHDSTPGGVLRHPMKLDDQTARRIARSWEESHGGFRNARKVAVLEEGMEWQQIGMTTEDAQYLLTRQFSIKEIARWFRVPPHLIGDLDRASFNNIEHMSLEFVMFTMMPWFRRWEEAIKRDLLVETKQDEELFAKFQVDDLLRGDRKTRYEAHRLAIMSGWKTRNEVRREEDMEPLEGLDEPLQQLNMSTQEDIDKEQERAPRGVDNRDKQNDDERARAIASAAAERIVRKEQSAIAKAKERHRGNAELFNNWLETFYADHVTFVQDALALSEESAAVYVGFAMDRVREEGDLKDPIGHVRLLVDLALQSGKENKVEAHADTR